MAAMEGATVDMEVTDIAMVDIAAATAAVMATEATVMASKRRLVTSQQMIKMSLLCLSKFGINVNVKFVF